MSTPATHTATDGDEDDEEEEEEGCNAHHDVHEVLRFPPRPVVQLANTSTEEPDADLRQTPFQQF